MNTEQTATATDSVTGAMKSTNDAFASATRETANSMSTASDRVRNAIKNAPMPKFDVNAYIETRHGDIDAMSKATAVAFESAQTIATKQAEWLKSSLEDMRGALEVRSGDRPSDAMGKEREIAGSSLSRTFDSVREMTESVQKSQAQIFEIAIERVRSNTELLRAMFGTTERR
ncbi:MAG: hypothetical protein NVS4B5_05270 [Vulcanimicrobiaceae bacterium]